MATRRASTRRSPARRTIPIDVDALWAIKRIGTPALSPDGSLACAAVTSFSMDTNAGTTELWLFPVRSSPGARAKPRR